MGQATETDIRKVLSDTRAEVKRIRNWSRRKDKELAQLEDELGEHGIGLETTNDTACKGTGETT